MSISKQIFFGASAAWLSRGLTILLSLLLLPILFRRLPKEELGVWTLVAQSWASLSILDFGFGVTLTRKIAFAKGKTSSDPNAPLTEDSKVEIAALLTTGCIIYRYLAIFAFVVSLSLGFFYFRHLGISEIPTEKIWISWALLCISFALTTIATPWINLLHGVGIVGWDAVLASFVSSITLIVQILAVLCGGGIIVLSLIAVTSALTQRYVFLAFVRHKRPEIFHLQGDWSGEIFREMAPIAVRAWLTAIGGTLILYSDQYIVTSLNGVAELPAYRAAWLLIHNITVIVVTLSAASEVFVSHLWQNQEFDKIHCLLVRNLRVGWILMIGAGGFLFIAAPSLFYLWLGPSNFIGMPIIIVFLIIETLEVQSYTIVTAARATGAESYAVSYLCAGIIKIVLSWLLASYWGLFGVALGTLVALLLTNHWFVPFHGLRKLGFRRRELITKVLFPCLLWIGLPVILVSACLHETIRQPNPLSTILVGISLISGILIPASWYLVLESGQRRRLSLLIASTLKIK